MRRFDGKIVLLTGAAGGFGRRTAERLAAEGARLILSDIKPDELKALAAALGPDTAFLAGDIAEEELSRSLVALAEERFGGLDIAINNAGMAQSSVKLPLVPSDEARRIIEVDLLGVFYAMKHQIPLMESQFKRTGTAGTIVNIASVTGLSGASRLSVYSAAKHGVVGLTRSAALEYATRGVRVNAVCPSFARTGMIDGFMKMMRKGESDLLAELTRGVPMKRVAEIDEVVEAILFAADPKNSFMTGHALPVDGGIGAL